MIFWLNVLILRYISFSLLEAIWYSVLHRQAIKSGLIATALKAQKFRLNYCFIYETFKQIHVVVNNYLFSSWYNLFSCFTNRYYLLQSFSIVYYILVVLSTQSSKFDFLLEFDTIYIGFAYWFYFTSTNTPFASFINCLAFKWRQKTVIFDVSTFMCLHFYFWLCCKH